MKHRDPEKQLIADDLLPYTASETVEEGVLEAGDEILLIHEDLEAGADLVVVLSINRTSQIMKVSPVRSSQVIALRMGLCGPCTLVRRSEKAIKSYYSRSLGRRVTVPED